MALVGFLLVGREGRDAGGIGRLDDGIEVIIDGFVIFFAEVGQVEGDAGSTPFGTCHELADLRLELDGIDENNIIRFGTINSAAGIEL